MTSDKCDWCKEMETKVMNINILINDICLAIHDEPDKTKHNEMIKPVIEFMLITREWNRLIKEHDCWSDESEEEEEECKRSNTPEQVVSSADFENS